MDIDDDDRPGAGDSRDVVLGDKRLELLGAVLQRPTYVHQSQALHPVERGCTDLCQITSRCEGGRRRR